ncbi:MAG: hypothetical protein HOW73_02460 [Polyangiaceae bacterium]|nr:hypothetical protein [Polyangiaceae bacterium]
MVDYRKFLRAGAQEVAALYLGGLAAYAAGGRTVRLRTTVDVAPGFYTFRVQGRYAEVIEPTEPLDLSAWPKETGHYACGYVAMPGGRFGTLELLGAPEPDVLGPVRARMHDTGAILFDEAPFEGEAEGAARTALEEGRGLGDVKGVSAALRCAFALATVLAAARARQVAVSPVEILKRVQTIAERGRPAADEIVEALVRARELDRIRNEEASRQSRLRTIADRVRTDGRATSRRGDAATPEERVERALSAAGARLLRTRQLGPDQIEVRYEYLGNRFVSAVHPVTLHVYDAGICLSGADEEVTLESLPSVIREAIEDDVLVITRR